VYIQGERGNPAGKRVSPPKERGILQGREPPTLRRRTLKTGLYLEVRTVSSLSLSRFTVGLMPLPLSVAGLMAFSCPFLIKVD